MPERTVWETVCRSLQCCYSLPETQKSPENNSVGYFYDNPVLELDSKEITEKYVDDENRKAKINGDISKPKSDSKSFDDFVEHSKSVDQESGYGISLGESLDDELQHDYLHAIVSQSNTKATYKISVQDRTKCWVVLRRQLEFIYIQEYLQNESGFLSAELPVDRKADVEELQAFVHQITLEHRLLQIEKVRTFFRLDCHTSCSSSSSSEIATSPSICRENTAKEPPLDGRFNAESDAQNVRNDLKVTKNRVDGDQIPLGCNERRISPFDFHFHCLIGKGSFGKVMLASLKENDHLFAVKVLSKKYILNRNETAHVLSERYVLTKVLRHPYIVQLHFAFTTATKIFFVLDYVSGGELFYHLQRERTFSEERTKFYAAEICSALTYIHSKGIVYRDLKPENILLDSEGHVVLTDFGLCKEGLVNSYSRTSTFCGTPEYLAPEIVLKLPYTRSVDWWTYGAVIYEMLYGLPPFYYKNVAYMYDAIVNKPLSLNTSISNNARDLLFTLLHKSAVTRLGAGSRDGKEIMVHQFFDNIDWRLVEKRSLKPPFIPKMTNKLDDFAVDNCESYSFLRPMTTSKETSTPLEDSPFRDFHYISPESCVRLKR